MLQKAIEQGWLVLSVGMLEKTWESGSWVLRVFPSSRVPVPWCAGTLEEMAVHPLWQPSVATEGLANLAKIVAPLAVSNIKTNIKH